MKAALMARSGRFALAAAALALCFARPLYGLARFALHRDLYSYILLVPFISIYLIWMIRRSLPRAPGDDRGIAALPLAAGVALLTWYWMGARSGAATRPEDSFALISLSFVAFLIGLFCLFYGRRGLKAALFPLAFLVFLSPLPVAVTDGIEKFLQHSSAAAADGLFVISGTPVFSQGLVFRLSDISIEVAPECSGIHSTLVLFLTSLLAGYLFLRSPWKRSLLTLAVIPLAILRNGFRVFTIGELCVHIGPQMIDSYIHRHGGPFFFILSLVPFFLLLAYLSKSESRGQTPKLPKTNSQNA
jgi:exosortase C (VPDSG-CTERM-specific)